MLDLKALTSKIDEYAASKKLPTNRQNKLFQKILNDAISKATTENEDGSFFVATGDIPAMWLRDGTFQILPYLDMIDEIPELLTVVKGLLEMELQYVDIDPYANAFNQTDNGHYWAKDSSNIPISKWVWERKFEIDSLCAVMFLAVKIYEKAKTTDHLNDHFWSTYRTILDVFKTEQHHETSPYFFNRTTGPITDTLQNNGVGSPIGYTGMVWSGFRPSDDRCTYGYFVPGNFFIISCLKSLLPLIPTDKTGLSNDTKQLIEDITDGIEKFAIVDRPESNGEKIYAYEVDGLGNANLMDDANVPSLLSLPFLGAVDIDDELYQNTRRFVLSKQNPYYFEGKVLEGIGSAHTPVHHVWPIALGIQGLTTNDILEKVAILQSIAMVDNGTGQCHEGVHMDDPNVYTRDWFSWSNMTYCQLALDLLHH